MGLILVPGTCRHCGCTDDIGCVEGCSWADPEHTLCTSCAKRNDEGYQQALLEAAQAELKAFGSEPIITLALPAPQAMVLLSNLQLALKHPQNDGPNAAVAQAIVEEIGVVFASAGCTALCELIVLGAGPAYDVGSSVPGDPDDLIDTDVLTPAEERGEC